MDKPWSKIKETHPWQGKYRGIVTKHYALPDGTEQQFDILTSKDAACVLALTENNELILIEQFRPGPEELLLDLPGGAIETGETAQQAAARELLEETGYEGKLEFVGIVHADAYANMKHHVFICHEAKKVSEQNLDEHERIGVKLVEFEQLLKLVLDQRFNSSGTALLAWEFLKSKRP